MNQVAMAHKRILLAALVGLFGCSAAGAQVVRDSVAELMGIDIIEHLGDSLPNKQTDQPEQPVTFAYVPWQLDSFNYFRPQWLRPVSWRCLSVCDTHRLPNLPDRTN